MITDATTATCIDEVAPKLYRIHTPVRDVPGGFSFNRYLLVDDQPLVFQTGPRGMAALTIQAIEAVMPVRRLRYIAFSHFENDECGALSNLLSSAPEAEPVCGRVNAMINGGFFDRAPLALADGAALKLGTCTVQWFDTPHLPHGWECGYLFEQQHRTLLCGDLFTQPGADTPALTTSDILGPSEASRMAMDYWAHARDTNAMLDRLANLDPRTLACMHGSAWAGDGGNLLRELGRSLSGKTRE